jgi:hypothetical protein
MNRLAAILVALVVVWGCSEEDRSVAPVQEDESALRAVGKGMLQPQQLEGEVRYSDGTIAPFGTMVRAYRNGVLVPGAEDETDSGNGHYGFSGSNSDWPTGWYFIQTDTVYRLSLAYEGHRWSYHVYDSTTRNQHITLTRVLPSTDGGEGW